MSDLSVAQIQPAIAHVFGKDALRKMVPDYLSPLGSARLHWHNRRTVVSDTDVCWWITKPTAWCQDTPDRCPEGDSAARWVPYARSTAQVLSRPPYSHCDLVGTRTALR